MKVIIAGSRTITDYDAVASAVDSSRFSITEIVCGQARGVDSLGERWAKEHGIPVKYFPADWQKHGKSAGHIRNCSMSQYGDALVLLWDGSSRGSANMRSNMKLLGKPIYEVIINAI